MNKKELAYIKQAIINEIEGYEFYKLAASQSEGSDTKATFLELAEEERKHVVWLQDLYKKIEDGTTSAIDLEDVEAPKSPHLFEWNKLDRENPSTVLSVFGIALQLEKSSYEFYDEMSKSTTDEKCIELFKILCAWEKSHYNMFDKEYNALKDEWWSEQGFAPF